MIHWSKYSAAAAQSYASAIKDASACASDAATSEWVLVICTNKWTAHSCHRASPSPPLILWWKHSRVCQSETVWAAMWGAWAECVTYNGHYLQLHCTQTIAMCWADFSQALNTKFCVCFLESVSRDAWVCQALLAKTSPHATLQSKMWFCAEYPRVFVQ